MRKYTSGILFPYHAFFFFAKSLSGKMSTGS